MQDGRSQIHNVGLLHRLACFDLWSPGDEDAVQPVATGVAADLTGDDAAVGGKEGKNDGPVAVQDDVQVWATLIVRAMDDVVARNDFVYQRLTGLWVAQV